LKTKQKNGFRRNKFRKNTNTETTQSLELTTEKEKQNNGMSTPAATDTAKTAGRITVQSAP